MRIWGQGPMGLYAMGTPKVATPAASVRAKPSESPRDAAMRDSHWPGAASCAAIFAVSFNLRPVLTSLPPLFPDLEKAKLASSSELAILASLPVLCFSLFSLIVQPLRRLAGERRAITITMLLLTTSVLARGISRTLLLPMTVLSAGAITVLTALLAAVMKDFASRSATILTCYLIGLYSGAALGSAVSVPIYVSSGKSLPIALGAWAIPTALGLFIWLIYRSHDPPTPTTASPATANASKRSVLRWRLAWLISAFMGLQACLYYAALNWLPMILHHRGLSLEYGGTLVSTLNLGGLAAAFIVPPIAAKASMRRVLPLSTAILSVASMIAVYYAPIQSAAIWCITLGLAQGSAIALATSYVVNKSGDAKTATSLSAMSQGIGYLIAAIGSLALGEVWVHGSFGPEAFLWLFIAVGSSQLILGLIVA